MDDNEIPLLSWSLHLLGEAEWAASALSSFVLAAVSLGLILVLKRVRSLACRAFVCGGRCVFFCGGVSALLQEACAFHRVCGCGSRLGIYSVTRSGLRTVPDGEFDWGGTSVKR
jgi:hypothetical protein